MLELPGAGPPLTAACRRADLLPHYVEGAADPRWRLEAELELARCGMTVSCQWDPRSGAWAAAVDAPQLELDGTLTQWLLAQSGAALPL